MTTENRIVGPGWYPKRPTKPTTRVRLDFGGVPFTVQVRSTYGTWDSMPWLGTGTYTVRSIGDGAVLSTWVVVDSAGSELYRYTLPERRVMHMHDTISITLRNPTAGRTGCHYADHRCTFVALPEMAL